MKKVLVLLVSLFTLIGCSNPEEISPIRKDIEELVFASGQLEWDDSYNLTAQTDGVLTAVSFEIGDQVTENETIAQIDNQINESSVSTTKKQLQIANEDVTGNNPALQQVEQNIQFAESKHQQDLVQLERVRKLLETNSISQVEYDNASLAAKSSLSNLNALKKQYKLLQKQARQQQITIEGQLENSQVLQNYNQVRVIKNGTVIRKFKSVGDFVRRGEVIATIANENKMEAVLNIDETSIEKVKLGQAVFVKLNTNKNKVFRGKISEILSAFDQQTQSFICKVQFTERLPHALFGTQLEANIKIGSKKNALLIPRNYVGFGNKVNIKGNKVMVQLKTGIVSSDYVEVLGGISESTILLPLKP